MAERPSILDPGDARPEARSALRDWMALQASAAFRPQRALEALRQDPDPRRALAALALRQTRAPDPHRELDSLLARLTALGIRAIPFGSPSYPQRLLHRGDAPLLLWIRGHPQALAARAVAVVGTRAPTRYGLDATRRLVRDLATRGLAIVSGLARGIDAAAHRAAIEAGGATIAVLGCGPDRVYPPEHARLARDVSLHGAVLSELPPATAPLPHHFPRRNRIISALAGAVVVVEARERSGSLITADHALDEGGEVLAVPGPVDAPTSAGSNRLLRQGAHPALDASDVLQALGLRTEPSRREPDLGLERTERAILDSLAGEPATPDDLARRLGVTLQTLARSLARLELDGFVARERDGRLRACRA